MKKIQICIILLLGITFLSASEKNSTDKIRTASTSATSSFSAMLSKTPLLLGKYHITGTTATLGTLGETIIENNSLTSFLNETGNWHTLSPRLGRQGLDHIFIKQDKMGRIRDLMIGETKYRNSQLGHTKDGIQMGKTWISKRLIAMGGRYIEFSKVNEIKDMPFLGDVRKMNVILNNGKEVYFWQKNSQDSWKFSGNPDELAEAQRKANLYGKYLIKAGSGEISYRSRIFQVRPSDNDIIISIRDAKNVGKTKNLSNLPELQNIRLKNAMNKNIDSKIIAAELKRKLPHFAEKDLLKIADKITTKALASRTTPTNIIWSYAKSSMITSLIANGVDIVIQMTKNGNVDWKQTGIVSGSVFVGTGFAHGLNWTMNKTLFCQRMLSLLSNKLGCSTSWLGSTISSTAGGFLVSALISYGMYFAGYSDLGSANVSFYAGAVGTTAGILTSTAMFSLAATFGTAGTGTPIASLYGAAATKAALAWLGGGTIASGGGGAIMGTVVVGGAVVVVAIVTSAAFMYAIHKVDEAIEDKRVEALLKELKSVDSLNLILQNSRNLDLRY